MVLLSNLTCVHLSGDDAGDFLHKQLSADILALSVGESTFACYCEPKGRVLALMLVSRNDDGYLVLMSAPLAESVSKRLRIYVMRAKVEIEVLEKFAVVGVGADNSQALDGQIATIAIPDSDRAFHVTSDAAAFDTDPTKTDEWKLTELRAGITWLCPETSGQFLPQMLGYDQIGAVNFRKGCYPGQEIVARTHYLGKVKRHPRLLCTPAIICPTPLEKIDILSGEQSYSAVITDCCHREDGGSCIFVVTRMDPDITAESIEYQGQIAQIL